MALYFLSNESFKNQLLCLRLFVKKSDLLVFNLIQNFFKNKKGKENVFAFLESFMDCCFYFAGKISIITVLL